MILASIRFRFLKNPEISFRFGSVFEFSVQLIDFSLNRPTPFKNTKRDLLAAEVDEVHQFPDIAGCSFGDTFGVSWKLCQ